MNSLEMRRKWGQLLERSRAIHAKAEKENRNLTGAEKTDFDKLLADAKELKADIDRISDLEQEERVAAEPLRDTRAGREDTTGPGAPGGGGDRTGPKTFTYDQNGARIPILARADSFADMFKPKPWERECSIGHMIRGVFAGKWDGVPAEFRTMSEGSDVAGGFTVGGYTMGRLVDKARNIARMFQAGALLIPMTAPRMRTARIVTDPQAFWKIENAPGTFSDPTFDAIEYLARMLTVYLSVSIELLEDSPDMVDKIEQAAATAIANAWDLASLYGSGVGAEPLGLKNVPNSNLQVMSATGALTYIVLSNAIQKVKEQNGEPNAVILNARNDGVLDRLIDSTSQPLTQPPSVAKVPRLVTNQLPNGDLWAGDFSNVVFALRSELRIEASREAGDSSGSAFRNAQTWIRLLLRCDVGFQRDSQIVLVTGIT